LAFALGFSASHFLALRPSGPLFRKQPHILRRSP
jgi:hypothetical protein